MKLHLAQILRRTPAGVSTMPLLAEDTTAHLCGHPRNAPGDTQGCPRWPACLTPGPRA